MSAAQPDAATPVSSAALEQLGLFPLPEVVLFPGVMLPLHVFEPRYRALIEDAMAAQHLIGVVQIKSATPVDAHGHPTLSSVAGVGEIVRAQRLPGGRFNVVLRGVCRVALEELSFVPPSRRARARVLPTVASPHAASDLEALVSCLQSVRSDAFAAELSALGLTSTKDLDPGTLADFLAAGLISDGSARQSVLETTSAAERTSLVCGLIAARRPAAPEADQRRLN